jgi:hypothetical protein
MGDGTAIYSFLKKIVRVQLYGTYTTIYFLIILDCSVHSTCSSCVTDPYYCGWCLTTGTCVSKGTCPTNTSITATPCIIILSSFAAY